MSDKDDEKICEQSEDENTNTNVKKDKKRKKKKSKKNKTKLEKKDSDDDVYDISPAKDRPWSPSMEDSDEYNQDKYRQRGRRDRHKATKRKEKKSFHEESGRSNDDGTGSQKEREIAKFVSRTTATGIGSLATKRELNGSVNMINVQPLHTGSEMYYLDTPNEKHGSANDLNGTRFSNKNEQSNEKTVHAAAKDTIADRLPTETTTNDMLKMGKTDTLKNDSQSDKQIKKKRKKKGKKQKKLQSERRIRIIVDSGTFPLENEKENVAAENENESKTTSSTSQNDKSISHIVHDIKENDGKDLAHENEKENADANESKPNNNKSQSDALLFPIIEDIEYNIEDEFQGNVEDAILTADPSIDIGQDKIAQNEDLPAILSALNLNCDCRACVGDIDVPSTNNTERSDQPIGLFRKLLKFLTCCFTTKVED